MGAHRLRGGNFGIVTRYFFRSPDASGNDPTELLPKAPQEVTTFKVEWDWKQLDEASFVALVRNYGQWCEENSEPDSPFARLFSSVCSSSGGRHTETSRCAVL